MEKACVPHSHSLSKLIQQMQTGVESCVLCKPTTQSFYTIANGRSGYTSLPPSTISPTSVSVSFIPSPTATNTTPLKLLTNGEPEASIDEDRAAEILKEEDLEVEIDLGNGTEEARVWTCDFSHVSLV
jgi:hypothetical protein